MLLVKENRDTSERSDCLSSNLGEDVKLTFSKPKDNLLNKKKIYSVIQCDGGNLLKHKFYPLTFV
jgi:hypothetical protein